MNFFRNGFYFLGAVILMVCIGVIVWYALIDSQRPPMEKNGTLAIEWQIRQRTEPQSADRCAGSRFHAEGEGQVIV